MKKIIALTFILLLGGGLLTGCNTMEGFGQDVENAGEEIEDEAS
jgi:predicted small secreted protein